jgi:hypothetical protein
MAAAPLRPSLVPGSLVLASFPLPFPFPFAFAFPISVFSSPISLARWHFPVTAALGSVTNLF